jgi:hypothetical protein
MIDLDKLLNLKEQLKGFSVQDVGNVIYLFYKNQVLAQFVDTGSTEDIRKKISLCLTLNQVILDNGEEIGKKFHEEAEEFVSMEVCESCDKQKCSRYCKAAKFMFNSMYRSLWSDYTRLN